MRSGGGPVSEFPDEADTSPHEYGVFFRPRFPKVAGHEYREVYKHTLSFGWESDEYE